MSNSNSITKEPLLEILKETYEHEVQFHLQEIYELLKSISSPIYDYLEVPTSGIRRDIQSLRDDGVLTFVDYNGTYFLNPHPVVNSK